MEQLSQASSPDFDYFLMVLLSCSIASFGLVTNSTAVIIGAMLIAPLMSPILGLSLASVAGESNMFRRALVALIEGALLAVALSAIIGWVSHELPFGALLELPSEVLSRTRPTPFDLGIALAGGAAAAYALAQPKSLGGAAGRRHCYRLDAATVHGGHLPGDWKGGPGDGGAAALPDQLCIDLLCRHRCIRRPGFPT